MTLLEKTLREQEHAKLAAAELDEVVEIEEDAESDRGKKKSQATVIVELCADLDLFHADDEAYAAVVIDGRRETWCLRSKSMRSLLARRFYLATKSAPGAQGVEDALRVLMGRAIHDGDERPVYTRIAGHNSAIYIDLCDEAWRAIEVDSGGWRIVDRPPVYFIRRRGMLALPVPRPGGTIESLRRYLNVADEADFRRIIGWLVQALRPRGPYPVLVFSGEQGSAKSTAARLLRALIDPSVAPIRTVPRDERDLIIAARNGWAICLDNLSGLQVWLSDALCRLATGNGFSARELYSDADEILIDVTRPVCINGIDSITTRPDLADRAVVVTLELIPDAKRKPEADLWRDFTQDAPGILGALLDAISCAIGRVGDVRLTSLPRMADHATWLEAASSALGWPAGQYVEEYMAARDAIVAGAADSSPVAAAIMAFIDQKVRWMGTASDLLIVLTGHADPHVAKSKYWPSSAVGMGNAVTRLAPSLRARGYTVDRPASHRHGRLIELGQLGKALSPPSPSVPPSPLPGDSGTAGDSGDGLLHTNPNEGAGRRRRVEI